MPHPIPFDEPCPCGSGESYRDCCGRTVIIRRRQRRNLIIAVIVIVAVAIPGLAHMYRLDQEKRELLTMPEGAYYSEDHSHWHDKDHQEIEIPGYIWSANQMRWIKVTDSLLEQIEAENARKNPDSSHAPAPAPPPIQNVPPAQRGVPEPPGSTAPEGQVWSEEHGHYHDADEDA